MSTNGDRLDNSGCVALHMPTLMDEATFVYFDLARLVNSQSLFVRDNFWSCANSPRIHTKFDKPTHVIGMRKISELKELSLETTQVRLVNSRCL